jgi:GNAT superfamily N-acetyltransferase
MEIRAVELADVSALGSLFVQWGHPLGPEDLRLQVRRWRDAPLAELYVALVQGELAGMAAIAAAPHLGRLGCTAKLMGLVVGERHRRQGVGHARKVLRGRVDLATEPGAALGLSLPRTDLQLERVSGGGILAMMSTRHC